MSAPPEEPTCHPMLKALELIGFKSFADKTRFEFPSGITVVVGPNGSGKSNVVDAIKWVLGEQSVKSLRGKEMSDVIFNGSGSRKPMNSAEITLTFDNSSNLLPIDTPEVHITRRVYRSGEGEYLINRQPSRLRDIRDLLSGTGLGAQAYSVIEQGKVDILLQSSSKDRRVIFEEAAGISRFKARKIEALRRLERVEQNLLRLSDIVDEVESRLRSVKLQAGKARRYQEYTDRLQELRTQTALVDWRRLSERIAAYEEDLASLTSQRDSTTAEAEAIEARLLEADTQAGQFDEQVRQLGLQATANRERIASAESTIQHERARSRDLEQEMQRHRRQLVEMSARAGGLEQQLRETGVALEAAQDQQRQIARRLGESERELTDLMARLDQLRGEHHERRTACTEQMRSAAALGNQIGALESQVAAALAARDRSQSRIEELNQRLTALTEELQSLRDRDAVLTAQADECGQQVADARTRLSDRRDERDRRQAELAQLQQRSSAMGERISLLEELEKRHEGLSPGVKEVLNLARSDSPGPYRQVCGLVADLLRVSVEAAPLVEVALGEVAQHVVVAPGAELGEYLQKEPYQFSGRVGFIWLEGSTDGCLPEMPNLQGRPGVMGRADRFVETELPYEPLARRLLGRTWIVEKLNHAMALVKVAGPGCSFITLSGELLAADGTLVVGPRSASTGLISRRSELRALKAQWTDLEGRIREARAVLERLDTQIVQDRRHLETMIGQQQQADRALSEHGHQITATEERHCQLDQQRKALQEELRAAQAQHESATAAEAQARVQQAQIESALADMEAGLSVLGQQMEQLEAQRQLHGRQATDIKIDLAKSEERAGSLRTRLRQFEESQQERQRAIAESREELTHCDCRIAQSQESVLRAESEIAELYLIKESFAARSVELLGQRESFRSQRAVLTSDAQRLRNRVRKVEEKLHTKELEVTQIRHERTALADRLREDYHIELAELEHNPSDQEQHERTEVQREIDELRQKINSLGNVNLEALEELQQLDARYTTLSTQHKDLTDAKGALDRIIEKINADSRRLFAETLQTVREHFGNLFRDLFGGGQADIVLEEGVDILESGVEIVARPPGKEPRSISLLSGGEKTMTCVALLLALFRSRPSPFCVLDEVDAALDEANIDRFTKVIQDFLTWTQFIIVTHSKKTMTCAKTIYGVTMQESGISRQVSVTFEDVSDNGEIRLSSERKRTPTEPTEDKDLTDTDEQAA